MIHLYAEHLLNIRALSIQAALSTVSNKETKATLSADGSILTLSHEGESASIRLPINLSPNQESTIKLTIPAVPSRELSFRLQLEEKEGVTNSVLSGDDLAPLGDGNVIPWTATSLTPQTEVSCRTCGSIFVDRGVIREWKDLPSEGWAEMMDFWHCHKPHEPHVHDQANSKKGYAAAGQLALRPGVAMVGIVDLLFAAGDSRNVEIPQHGTVDAEAVLLCAKCQHSIGHTDPSNGSYQLRKPQLSLSISPDHSSFTYKIEKWFACLILSAMDSQGSRKFVAQEINPDHGTNTNKALKLWIFTPDLLISSSQKSSTDYIRVCKIMWQECEISSATASDPLTASLLSEGELRLQRGELALLTQILRQSSTILPEEARRFQEWQVALLERFISKDL